MGVDLGSYESETKFIVFENLEKYIWFILNGFLHQWEN